MIFGKDTLISDVADAYRTVSGTEDGVKAGQLAEKIASMTVTAATKGIIYMDYVGSMPTKVLLRGVNTVSRNLFYTDDNPLAERIASVENDCDIISIGSYAFAGLEELTNIDNLVKNCESIGSRCFQNCTGLTEVLLDVSEDAVSIPSIFSGCDNLEKIYVPFNEGDLIGAPWGAPNAEIIYNWRGSDDA